jgi:hypothetical protein
LGGYCTAEKRMMAVTMGMGIKAESGNVRRLSFQDLMVD